MINFNNNSRYSWQTYKYFFMKIWISCIAAGYGTQDAREYAQLEWEKFIEEQKQNEIK